MSRRLLISLEFCYGIRFLRDLGNQDRPLDCVDSAYTSFDFLFPRNRDANWLFDIASGFLWLIMLQAANDKAMELTISRPAHNAKHGRITYRGDYPEHECAPYPATVYPALVQVVLNRGCKVKSDSASKCGTLAQLAAGNSKRVFANWRFHLNHGDGTLKFFLTSGPFKE